MTNNLPEVGKRYRKFDSYGYWTLKDIRIERRIDGKREATLVSSDGLCTIVFDLKNDFWEEFEELPEKNSNQVEEAKDELEYHANIANYFDKDQALQDIKEAAKNLLNALDSQKPQDPKGEEVSHDEYYACVHHQNFSPETANYFEFILSKQNELEQRIKKLEKNND